MTSSQRSRTEIFLNIAMGFLIASLMVVSFSLVVLYNRLVTRAHAIADIKEQYNELQTHTAELKDATFSLMNGERLEALAAERGLVKDQTPLYRQVDEQWFLASHF